MVQSSFHRKPKKGFIDKSITNHCFLLNIKIKFKLLLIFISNFGRHLNIKTIVLIYRPTFL